MWLTANLDNLPRILLIELNSKLLLLNVLRLRARMPAMKKYLGYGAAEL
jgi:hypothetical protein